MVTEVVNESVVYQITVRGPNGEEEKMNVSSEDSGSILKQRIMMSPKFTVYTAFHFEVENPSGKEDLFLDAYTPFSQVPLVGNGATFLLVPDLYDATSIRYHIKHSVALLTNKIPLISQLVKLSNDELPESLKDFNEQMKANAKNLEEKKEVVPLDMKTRLVENGRQADSAYKDLAATCMEDLKKGDLSSFMQLYTAINTEKPVSIKSLTISSYNPADASRRAMGDLIYLRVAATRRRES